MSVSRLVSALATDVAASCAQGRYDCGHITRSSVRAVKRAVFLYAAEVADLGYLGGRNEPAEVLAALALMRDGATCADVIAAGQGHPLHADLDALLDATTVEVPDLGAQQITLLGYVSEGLSFPEIATEMGLSVETVRSHSKRAMRATMTHSIVDAAVWAAAQGLI